MAVTRGGVGRGRGVGGGRRLVRQLRMSGGWHVGGAKIDRGGARLPDMTRVCRRRGRSFDQVQRGFVSVREVGRLRLVVRHRALHDVTRVDDTGSSSLRRKCRHAVHDHVVAVTWVNVHVTWQVVEVTCGMWQVRGSGGGGVQGVVDDDSLPGGGGGGREVTLHRGRLW